MESCRRCRSVIAIPALILLSLAAGASQVALGICGPFTDVAADAFCPAVLEIFSLGITSGTTATTYDPSGNVTRLQMAAFLSRTVDRALQRGSRRAAIGQFWTTQGPANLGITTLSTSPNSVQSDGTDLWVAGTLSVQHVAGGTGKVLDSWTGATNAYGTTVAMGRVFVTDLTNSNLYRIDPTQPAGALSSVATLDFGPFTLAFDGSRLWSGNDGSVSIITPTASLPWTVTNVTTGFSAPSSVIYDGANIWTADIGDFLLLKLDSNGTILQTVTVGPDPLNPVFDGTNLWVPNNMGNSVSVVRASTGAVLATLTGNGLDLPRAAAFDGQRVLVINTDGPNASASLWKAADLTAMGSFNLGTGGVPWSVCSDGVSFWITLHGPGLLARF
jgi:hypothetical protein